MKIENGKIAECTELELYDFYLTRGWDEIYSFPDYMQRCVANGTKIIEIETEDDEDEDEDEEREIKLNYRTCDDEDIKNALRLYAQRKVDSINIVNLYPGWFVEEYDMEIDEHEGYDMDWWGHFHLDGVEIQLHGCCMWGYILIERDEYDEDDE